MENREVKDVELSIEGKLKELCEAFLDERWTKSENFVVSKIEAGVANRIYKCSMTCGSETKSVIVRFYGSELLDVFNNHFAEKSEALEVPIVEESGAAVMSDNLAKEGLAPKLLGVFAGGRVEEFVKGRNLVIDDFAGDKSLYSLISRKLAKFHLSEIPIRRRPMHLKSLENFAKITLNVDYSTIDAQHQEAVQKLSEFPMETEVSWFIDMMPKIGSKIVFSHNDISLNNIMLNYESKNDNERILFVDFDMSGYHYRGYDLSFFLHVHEFRVSPSKEAVIIEYTGKSCPEDEKKLVIEEYLCELKALDPDFNDQTDNYSHLNTEVDFFELIHYLVLIMFTKLLFLDTSKTMSYDHIMPLLRRYSEHKNYCIANYSDILN